MQLPRTLGKITLAWSLFMACATAPLVRAEDDSVRDALQQVYADYYTDYAKLYPIEAAMDGDAGHRFEDVWPNDLTPEFRARVLAFCDRYLAALKRFDRASLSRSDRLSTDMLRWNLTLRREGVGQFFHLMPVNQIHSPVVTFAQMGSGSYIHQFKTPQDYRNFLSRAKGFSAWVDCAIANMREGMGKGIVSPRALMEKTLLVIRPLMTDDAEHNVFFGPLKHLPEQLTVDGRVKLSSEYSDGIRTIVLPAYQRLHAFIHDEYLPHCRDTAGLGALPGGADAYAYLVRMQTTSDLSPDQIHEIGLSEVARVRGEMDKIRGQVGFGGNLGEFLTFVATDPSFAPFNNEEEVLNAYRAIEKKVMARIPQFFGKLPRTRFEIRATEKFRAASASAEYIAGTIDGSRPGIFYVPIPDPTKARTTRMEDLFLHEAIPGHHFQASIALENSSLPLFRRYDSTNAFVEGWGLYAESLGSELGMYSDPDQKFGRLLYDMHRAVRLVVDTGMHAKGWTREQAIQYEVEQEGGTAENHAPRIERYMAIPAQALSYKIGELKFRELRAAAEKQLGSRFDLRSFHDEILAQGSMPLSILDDHMRRWISEQAGH